MRIVKYEEQQPAEKVNAEQESEPADEQGKITLPDSHRHECSELYHSYLIK